MSSGAVVFSVTFITDIRFALRDDVDLSRFYFAILSLNPPRLTIGTSDVDSVPEMIINTLYPIMPVSSKQQVIRTSIPIDDISVHYRQDSYYVNRHLHIVLECVPLMARQADSERVRQSIYPQTNAFD